MQLVYIVLSILFSRGLTGFSPVSKTDLEKAVVDCIDESREGNCDLQHGPIGQWKVSSVSSTSKLFNEATYFDADLSKWDVSSVTNMYQMFGTAEGFSEDLSKWDVSRVTSTSRMFHGASAFNSDLSKWDVSKVTTMAFMFAGASLFASDLSEWTVSSVGTMWSMFNTARSFNSNISKWNVLRVTDMREMFYDATSFNQTLSGKAWVNSKAGRIHMFTDSSGWIEFSPASKSLLESAVSDCLKNSPQGDCKTWRGPIGQWKMSSVSSMSKLFNEATSFDADLSKWDVSSVTNMYQMFGTAEAFSADLSKWNVSKVTSTSRMFYGASAFNSDLSKWDVSKVTAMSYMFAGASLFASDLSEWKVSKVTSMDYMFAGASSFNADISKWSVSGFTDMEEMFYAATSFKQTLCGEAWIDSKAEDTRIFRNSSGSISKTVCGGISELIVFNGDFEQVVGQNKKLFLKECTDVLSLDGSKVRCIDVHPGSVVVEISGLEAAVAAAVKAVKKNGLNLQSFGKLSVPNLRKPKKPVTSASLRTTITTVNATEPVDEGLSTEALAAIVVGATVGTLATVGVVTAVGVGATAAGAGAAVIGTGAAVAGAGATVAASAGATVAAGAGATVAAGAGATVTAGTGAAAASFGATAAGGAAATVAGAGATVAGSATTGAATIVAVTGSVAGVAITTAAALLAKYGLKRRSLDKTNLLIEETPAQRMVSKEVLQVKDAPDMTLMESLRHMTFLLSDKGLKFIKGRRNKPTKAIEHEIEQYTEISHVLSSRHLDGEHETADAAERMHRTDTRYKIGLSPIKQSDRDFLVSTAKRCLSWARDPARVAVHGAENITVEQAAAIMLYTQETCLYPRLNTALRNHDLNGLEPFLPFMKLLLSGLYRLPLTRVPTYRGVKCELYKTYNELVGKVWSWWSFSSTTQNMSVLKTPMFLGSAGKRTLFRIDALGVDIASFSAMPGEAEVLLLPGLPLVNRPGEQSEPDMWTFEVATPDASNPSDGGAPSLMIDYVHPGWTELVGDQPVSIASPDTNDDTGEDDSDSESGSDDTEEDDSDSETETEVTVVLKAE